MNVITAWALSLMGQVSEIDSDMVRLKVTSDHFLKWFYVDGRNNSTVNVKGKRGGCIRIDNCQSGIS